jgi:hypothetical protein
MGTLKEIIIFTIVKPQNTMSKKSIDRKAASQFIVDNRAAGKSDQEIYNELTQQYYDKKAIALLITSTVTDENKSKYKVHNRILLVLIGITIVFKVLTVVNISLSASQLWYLLLLFLLPILNIYFFYEIYRYTGAVYRFLGLLTIISFLQGISKMASLDIMINAFLCIGISGLAFYLDANMIPKYSPNSLKKDSNDEYILK